MVELTILLARLHSQIGAQATYRNSLYNILEIIDDIPAIIIQKDMPPSSIQGDMYGRARKHTKDVVTIHILNSDKSDIGSEFQNLRFI